MSFLDIVPGECVAVVGAGGKTSLCLLLTRDLVVRGSQVVFTTTTHIREPAPGVFDVLQVGRPAHLPSGPWRTACLAEAMDGSRDDTRVQESLMPSVHTKLTGFGAEELCTLRATRAPTAGEGQPLSFVVEADGARGRWLKAPSAHEPVIPPCATTVCVVANLQALGEPLDERVAHRLDRIAQLTGARARDRITPDLLVALLAHPEGGLKGIPPGARAVAVLMQRDETLAHPAAGGIVEALVARGFEQAVVISPRAPHVSPLAHARRLSGSAERR